MAVNSSISSFGRHALKMASGTVFAQLIPILGAPILTRLYTPKQFGAAAVFVGFCTVASVVTSGRYELAIVLPRKQRDAFGVLIGSILLSFSVCAVGWIGIAAFHPLFETIFRNAEPASWLYLAPAMIFSTNVYQALGYWANRRRHYGRMAGSLITQQGGTVGGSVALGLAKTQSGLIMGRLIGQALPAITMSFQFRRVLYLAFRITSFARIKKCFRQFRQFPLFNVPYSLSGSFGREFTVFALTSFNYTQAAGCFALARMFTYIPAGFLSASLSQVFYKEAAEHIGTPRVEDLTLKLMKSIAAVATPAYVFLMFWAPDGFSLIFGAQWHDAGRYASAYAPAGFLFLFTGWPERIYEVTGKQHISFSVQFISDGLSVFTLLLLLWFGVSPLLSIVGFSLLSCGYQTVYLSLLFRAGGFRQESLVKLAGLILRLVVFSGTVCLLCRWTFHSVILQSGSAIFIFLCYYILWARGYLRRGMKP